MIPFRFGVLGRVAAVLLLMSANTHAGSFKTPDACSLAGTDCDYRAEWTVDNTAGTITITIGAASVGGWASIGFSTNKFMDDTDIYRVYVDGVGTVEADNRWADSQDEPTLDTPKDRGMSGVSGSRVGGYLEVTFTRLLDTGATDGFDVDLSGCPSFFFLFVTGPGSFGEHPSPGSSQGPRVSETVINVCSSSGIAAALSTKASSATLSHGILMMVAWLALSAAGSFTAHYLKHLGKPWFILHVVLQLSAAGFTIVSAIIILTTVPFQYGTHQNYGVAVFALMGVQVLMGVFRDQISAFDKNNSRGPHDHGPRRWLFQLFHWTIGWSLLIVPALTTYHGLALVNPDSMANALLYFWAGLTGVVVVLLEMVGLHERQAQLPKGARNSLRSHVGAFYIAACVATVASMAYIVNETPH